MPRRRSPAKTRSRRSVRRSLRRSARRSPRRSPKRSAKRRSPKRRTGRTFRGSSIILQNTTSGRGEVHGDVSSGNITFVLDDADASTFEFDKPVHINGEKWQIVSREGKTLGLTEITGENALVSGTANTSMQQPTDYDSADELDKIVPVDTTTSDPQRVAAVSVAGYAVVDPNLPRIVGDAPPTAVTPRVHSTHEQQTLSRRRHPTSSDGRRDTLDGRSSPPHPSGRRSRDVLESDSDSSDELITTTHKRPTFERRSRI